ncbi:MAG: cytochrome P450 [Sphingobium sp.]
MAIPQHHADAIVDPKAYQDAAPVDEAFAAIRRDHPFDVAHPQGYAPFWVASRHADIVEIERQPDLFHAGDRPTVLANREAEQMAYAFTGEPNLIRSLVSIDGMEHKQIRAVTFSAFTPAAIRKWEEVVRTLARRTVDEMVARAPECDFAADIAFLYPLRVVMRVLGVPDEDQPMMLKLTQEIFSSNDPELNRNRQEVTPAEAMAQLNQTMLDLEAYFGKVTEKLRADPDGSVNSLIANARIGDDYLNRRQLMGYYIIAATAGHDTTSNALAGAMWAMAQDRAILPDLQADPGLIPGFIEESIRWTTPVKHFMRTATADTQVAGRDVAKGDWIMLSYHSANRDEAAFADPFTFDHRRKPNKQIAFGYGPHVCLGQHLARMENRILWEEMLPRLKSLELAGTPELTRSNFVCGPKHVPIRFSVH